MAGIGEVLHADIAALFAPEIDQLAHHERGWHAAYRRHRAIGHASAIIAVTGRAGAVELFAARSIRRCRERVRQFRSARHQVARREDGCQHA
ncbi:MAG: hypothetical protein R3E65_02495 [Steroidobacteraceae bacterium]